MAIGKMSPAGKSFSSAAEYDLAQGKYAEQEAQKQPEILDKNFISASHYKELGKEFREVSNDNKKCTSPVLKFSVSFDTKEKLTDTQKLEFTKKVMNEMGIKDDNHQYLITRHSDKGHDHHHILANRVGMDGKVIDVSHSVPKLEKAIDKTEKQMGLNNDLAKTRRFVFDPSEEKGYKVQKENFRSNRGKVSTISTKKGIAEKKEYIKNNVEKSLQESKSLSELQTKLQEKNISVDARIDKANKLTGISFKYDNFSVKGSAMGKEFKASGIEREIKNNIDRENTKTLPKTEVENKYQRFENAESKRNKPFDIYEERQKVNQKIELRKETLQNLDKAIEKLEPHKENQVKYYEDIKVVREGVKTNQIDNIEDLKRANQFAKTHIRGVEMIEKENQKQEQEKPKTEEKNYSRFDQIIKPKREINQDKSENQEEEKKRGRGR